MRHALDRVVELEALRDIIKEQKSQGKTVIQCHGCFDILHSGHLKHFEAAKEYADFLIVTITPDKHINKGPDRPVFPAEQRAELLAGLSVIDWVAINRWPSAVEAIEILRPTYFAKGQEYEPKGQQVNPNFEIEKKVVERCGGQIVFTYEWTSSSSMAWNKINAVY